MKNCHKILIEMHHSGAIPANEWAHLIASVDGLLGDWLEYTLGDEGVRPFNDRCRATVDNLTALSTALPVTWPGQNALIGAITQLQVADRAISKVFELNDPATLKGEGGQSDPLPLRRHSHRVEVYREPELPKVLETVQETAREKWALPGVGFITHDGQRIQADGRSAPL